MKLTVHNIKVSSINYNFDMTIDDMPGGAPACPPLSCHLSDNTDRQQSWTFGTMCGNKTASIHILARAAPATEESVTQYGG